MEKKNCKERNAGVDLLRIVSMLMVVILHILGQGGVLAGVSAAPQTAGYAVAYLLESCCFLSINSFALVSGYVGAEGHFRYARLFETQLRVLFYTVLITAGFCIAMPELFGFTLIKNALFPAMTGQYWYYTAYFGLMLFMPALQCMIAHLSRARFRNLILSILLLFSILPALFVRDIFQTAQGYSLWWLIALYLVGAYIKIYGCPFLKKTIPALAVYALSVLAAWGIQLADAYGVGIPLPNMLVYTSPAMLLGSIALLVAFSGYQPSSPVKKAISLLAPLSFSVYLIHAHPLIWEHLFAERFRTLAEYPAAGIVFVVIGIAVGVYILCSLADMARVWLFRVCRVSAACEKLGAKVEKILGTD